MGELRVKYESLELSGFLAFQFSNIKKLTLDTAAITQLIIGANGSGKSSLLRECTPRPANRPDYEPGGYKKVILTHHGSEYMLLSDFGNRERSHSFTKDGVELNKGGTATVQDDLVRDHLGYSKTVEDIVTGKHNFARSPAGLRKSLLMTLNPFQIEFILDHYKSVMSSIRACKNNLTMLYERKATIETEMLSDEVTLELEREKAELDKELSVAVEYIHRLSEKIRGLDDTGFETSVNELDAYRSKILDIRREAPAWKDIPRGNLGEIEATLDRRISDQETRIPMFDERIHEHVQDVNKYQSILDEIEEKTTTGDLNSEIDSLTAEIDSLSKSLIDDPFSSGIMDELPEVLETLKSLVSEFLGCQVRLIGSISIQRKRQYREKHVYRIGVMEKESERLRERQLSLDDTGSITENDLPRTNCAKMACPLFASFKASQEKAAQELNRITEANRVLNHHLTRARLYVDGVTKQLTELEVYIPHLVSLFRLLREYPYLRTILGDMDILAKLQSQPMQIYNTLMDHYQNSLNVYRHHSLTKSLEEKLATRAKLAETDASERHLIDSILSEKQDALAAVTRQKQSAQALLDNARGEKKVLAEYRNATAWVERTKERVSELLKEAGVSYEKSLYTEVKSILETFRTEAISRMGKIDHTLKGQMILKARYESEVMGQIEKIEARRKELLLMATALSPNDGLPHGYTVRFINALIASMNYYISQVFNYHFELIPLNDRDSIDYKFSAQAGDVLVPDISTCSDAQQEMINLAFMLALIRHLNLEAYPIYLDEVGRSFDHHHKQQLLNLFKTLLDEASVSQMFVVNHHSVLWGGLTNLQILVLNELNIMLPPNYNEHAIIEKA